MNTGLPSDLVPAARLDSFGTFWIFLSLSVGSSVIPIADVIFEHRVYLPSAGFFIAPATLLFAAAERAKTTAPNLSGQLCRRWARRPRSGPC